MPDTLKNPTIYRVIGFVLLILGIASAYFHYPIDHPWQMDVVGFSVSLLLIGKPSVIIQFLESKAKQKSGQ